MKKENQSSQEPLINWEKDLGLIPFNEKFKVDGYVAWHNCYTKESVTTVDVVGDIGDKYFYTFWTHSGEEIIKYGTSIFNNKQEFKDWLKSIRETSFDNRDNLLDVVRFLYF
jgi:hypothetical protein